MRSRLVLFCLLAVVALVAVACGDDTTSSAADTTAAAADTTSSAADTTPAVATNASFNEADVTFAQGMIPHHAQAIEMAEIALDESVGASERVLDLASRIKQAQGPEIGLMTGWLEAWGEPIQMGSSEGHDMSSTDDASLMAGMMSKEDMAALHLAKGTEFDVMWLRMMVRHHEGAIEMAETVKADGAYPAVLALADQIIVAQQREIDEMNGALGK